MSSSLTAVASTSAAMASLTSDDMTGSDELGPCAACGRLQRLRNLNAKHQHDDDSYAAALCVDE